MAIPACIWNSGLYVLLTSELRLILKCMYNILILNECYSCSQEPVSVALATLNLAMQFHGWVSFLILLYYKLPLRPDKKTFYEYTGLWHIYGILAMNAWFWNAVFHSR